jgi:hypothetical protein
VPGLRACRAAWNREHLGDPAVQASALTWSLAAMSEATALLPAVKTADHPQAFAAIGESVWWITMVDATVLRHHPASSAWNRPWRQPLPRRSTHRRPADLGPVPARRHHAHGSRQRPTARASCALLIDERPFTPRRRASA